MSLTWHIVRKDLYRLRWVLLLWVVALVGELALAMIESGLDQEGRMPFYMAAFAFGSIFVPVISFGLVMGLQDDDSVVATDAFWMARPLSGGRLLGAKAISLALLCLLPLLVRLPFWIFHGFPAYTLWIAALHTEATQGLTILVAVPFAVISPNAGRFILNVILGCLAVVIPVVAFRFIDGGAPASPSLLMTRALAIFLLWSAAAVAMALNQYCRRRLRATLAILGAAIAAVFFVEAGLTSAYPFDLDALANNGRVPPPEKMEVAAQPAAAVAIDGSSLQIVGLVPNSPQGPTVEVSESAPEFARGVQRTVGVPRTVGVERYFLVNRQDGRSVEAQVARSPDELEVASLRFFRTTLRFNTDRDLAPRNPPNIGAWVKEAVLMKVFTPETGPLRLIP